MQKILSYPISLLYYLAFGFCLCFFHPIQWFCLNFLGYDAHKKSVAVLNWFLMRCLNILGTRFTFSYPTSIPQGVPLIIVSNHQSMYDIPPLIWHLRKYHPKFVSKRELGKGIPSVSFNLRHGGSVLINRKDAKQALEQIKILGQYIEENTRSAVIFPEGTRSRDGFPKPFKKAGLEALVQNAPSAWILPVSISNSWKLLRYGAFPMGLGAHLKFKIHPPIKPQGDIDNFIKKVQETVHKGIEN